MAEVIAVCISDRKGVRKTACSEIRLRFGYGILGDAHGGNWHRQISLLGEESIETMRRKGLELTPGAFAENIVTRGVKLKELPVGTMLQIGEALVCVTQIGKECHNDCAIKRATGSCVMPTDGIFAVVVREGTVRAGDPILIKEGPYEAD